MTSATAACNAGCTTQSASWIWGLDIFLKVFLERNLTSYPPKAQCTKVTRAMVTAGIRPVRFGEIGLPGVGIVGVLFTMCKQEVGTGPKGSRNRPSPTGSEHQAVIG